MWLANRGARAVARPPRGTRGASAVAALRGLRPSLGTTAGLAHSRPQPILEQPILERPTGAAGPSLPLDPCTCPRVYHPRPKGANWVRTLEHATRPPRHTVAQQSPCRTQSPSSPTVRAKGTHTPAAASARQAVSHLPRGLLSLTVGRRGATVKLKSRRGSRWRVGALGAHCGRLLGDCVRQGDCWVHALTSVVGGNRDANGPGRGGRPAGRLRSRSLSAGAIYGPAAR